MDIIIIQTVFVSQMMKNDVHPEIGVSFKPEVSQIRIRLAKELIARFINDKMCPPVQGPSGAVVSEWKSGA
jgi:hypothetical protein